jgi:hypothetical protein
VAALERPEVGIARDRQLAQPGEVHPVTVLQLGLDARPRADGGDDRRAGIAGGQPLGEPLDCDLLALAGLSAIRY